MIFGFFNSFLFGVILISLIDFIIFLFLKINFFNALDIDEYFNDIFVQNHNFYMILLATIPVGYLFIYSPIKKLFEKIYLLVIIIATFGFYPQIGMQIGSYFFLQKEKTITLGSTTFVADILYIGKNHIYLKRAQIEKTIKIEKNLVTYN